MNTQKRFSIIPLSFALVLSFLSPLLLAETLERIIAIVEQDVVLDRELIQEVALISQKIKDNNMPMPPPSILRKQVLERLILQKLQSQLALRSGAQISDEMLLSAVTNIARENNMSYEEFRATFEKQGLDYQLINL